MKTLVVGHTTHDHYQGGFVAGGCAYYGARAHHALAGQLEDTTSHLYTLVGEDFQCHQELRDLDLTLHQAGSTTVFANYYPSDGPRVQLLEAIAPDLVPGDFPPIAPDLVHLAPVLGELDLLQWKEAFPEAMIAINVQGWIKTAGPLIETAAMEETQRRGIAPTARSVVQKPWDISAEQLRGIHIACLSDEDLIDQGDLLDRLLQSIPIVALTHGERGSTIYVNRTPSRVGIYPTDAVDPTGAGDVFAATFSHQIAAGLPPLQAARFATAASSIVIEDEGARALVDRPDLGEWNARAARISLF